VPVAELFEQVHVSKWSSLSHQLPRGMFACQAFALFGYGSPHFKWKKKGKELRSDEYKGCHSSSSSSFFLIYL